MVKIEVSSSAWEDKLSKKKRSVQEDTNITRNIIFT